MSFTNRIKTKISERDFDCDCCPAAFLAGAVRFCGSFRGSSASITTENKHVAECIKYLLSESIGIIAGYSYRESAKYYRFDLSANQSEILAAELAVYESPDSLLPFDCCRKSFLAGAFLGGGSINDPKKSYHLEFDTKSQTFANEILSILDSLGIGAKLTTRKSRFVVYIKGSDAIAAVLGIIGADFAALELYSASVEKEIRNDVNRRVNCENANLDKLAQASSKQIYAIEKIKKNVGLDALSETLREIAHLRLEYPEESLKELGERLNPPLGKSGVNHRLNRIIDFANNL